MFKRKTEGRKKEAKKAKDKHIDSSDLQSIRNKLGLRNTAPVEKIKFELNRLKHVRKSTLKSLDITDDDFKRFGIER